MTVAQFSLADASIAQMAPKDGGKKSPPKRTATPVTDQRLVPEPR